MNWLEKRMNRKQEKTTTFFLMGGLLFFALFLAIEYINAVGTLFEGIFPIAKASFVFKILYVLLITIIVMFLGNFIKKSFDGK